MTRAIVTGIGVVTPIGTGREEFWDALIAGRSGGRELHAFDASDYPIRIGAEVDDFDPTSFLDAREAARTDRFAQMAIVAAGPALGDAGLEEPDPTRTGVIVGSGIGGL